MNLLDRSIAYFNPERAAQRLLARRGLDAMAGMAGHDPVGSVNDTNQWNSASRVKRTLRSWLPKLFGSPREDDGKLSQHGLSPREVTMARARDLVRNVPLASGAIDTLVSNAVGTGLTLQSRVDWKTLKITEDDALLWQQDTETKFAAWAESPDCDVARSSSFYQQQDLALRSARVDGDLFFMIPKVAKRPENDLGIAVQLIAADRVANPKAEIIRGKDVYGGIEVDEYGAESKFWVSKKAPGDDPNRTFTAYDAFDSKGRRQFFHLMRKKRIDQRRGMSYFAPVIDMFRQLGEYSDAELQAAVISAFFTVFVSSKSGQSLPALDFDSEGTGGGTGPVANDEIKLGAGAVVEMPDDTTITTANPGRPNEKFDPFVQAILRQIGVGLQIPFEVLVKHFTSSYSAARAALLDAWKFFKAEREWLAVGFCQPVYERWLDFMVAKGRIQAPGYFDSPEIRRAYRMTAWVGDEPGSLDPEKEVNAAEKRLVLGLSDLDEESIAATGTSYIEKHSRIVKLAKLRSEAGLLVSGGVPPAPLAPVGPDGKPVEPSGGPKAPPAGPQGLTIEMPMLPGTKKISRARREGEEMVIVTEVVNGA